MSKNWYIVGMLNIENMNLNTKTEARTTSINNAVSCKKKIEMLELPIHE